MAGNQWSHRVWPHNPYSCLIYLSQESIHGLNNLKVDMKLGYYDVTDLEHLALPKIWKSTAFWQPFCSFQVNILNRHLTNKMQNRELISCWTTHSFKLPIPSSNTLPPASNYHDRLINDPCEKTMPPICECSSPLVQPCTYCYNIQLSSHNLTVVCQCKGPSKQHASSMDMLGDSNVFHYH